MPKMSSAQFISKMVWLSRISVKICFFDPFCTFVSKTQFFGKKQIIVYTCFGNYISSWQYATYSNYSWQQTSDEIFVISKNLSR